MRDSFKHDTGLALLHRRQDAVPVLQDALEVVNVNLDVILPERSEILGIDWSRRRAIRGFTLPYLLLYRLLDDEILRRLFW